VVGLATAFFHMVFFAIAGVVVADLFVFVRVAIEITRDVRAHTHTKSVEFQRQLAAIISQRLMRRLDLT